MGSTALGRRRLWRRLSGLSAVALPLLGAGCAAFAPEATPKPAARAVAGEVPGPVARQRPEDVRPARPAVVAVSAEQLGAPKPAEAPPAPPPINPAADLVLPISLDVVLQRAEDQNTQIALARERLREAYAQKAVARLKWLPDVYVGTAYYRHEGGILAPSGRFLDSSFGSVPAGMEVNGQLDVREVAYLQSDAKGQVSRQKAELSRIKSEQLLDAADTYLDLLSALSLAAIARETEQKLEALLDPARRLAKEEGAAKVQVEFVAGEVEAQRQNVRKMQENAAAAAAKLAYLLRADPCARLLPTDGQLVPFELIDADTPVCDLINQAQTTGPGVQELGELLAQIRENVEKGQGLGKYSPVFGLRLFEGGFGGGPGDQMTWDNRLDVALQVRWNLTELPTQKSRQRVTASRIQQVHLTYDDLQYKLRSQVVASHETVRSGLEQFPQARRQIEHGREAYRFIWERFNETQEKPVGDVLSAIRALAGAEAQYVKVLRDYDRAQVQLLVLTGAGAVGRCVPGNGGTAPVGAARE